MDSALTFFLARARAAGRDIAIVTDYGFSTVHRPVHIIWVLPKAGFLDIEVAANGDQVAMGTSSSLPSAISRLRMAMCAPRRIFTGFGRY
jgi:hypothetical protein